MSIQDWRLCSASTWLPDVVSWGSSCVFLALCHVVSMAGEDWGAVKSGMRARGCSGDWYGGDPFPGCTGAWEIHSLDGKLDCSDIPMSVCKEERGSDSRATTAAPSTVSSDISLTCSAGWRVSGSFCEPQRCLPFPIDFASGKYF